MQAMFDRHFQRTLDGPMLPNVDDAGIRMSIFSVILAGGGIGGERDGCLGVWK